MKNKKIKGGELTLYIIYAVLALGGLTLIVLNMVGMSLPNINNALREADNTFAKTMKMSFLVFGSLVLLLAAILSAITLAVNGQKAEVIAEKKARRQQRLSLENIEDELQ